MNNVVSPHYRLLIFLPAAFAALGGFLFGYDTGVISGAILFMKTQFQLSTRQTELIVSIISVGAVFGSLLAGPLSDRFGRKKILLFTSLLYVFSAFIQGLAQTITTIIYGRVLVGIAIGLSSTTAPLYIAEIAYREKRGMLVTINQLAITLGILFSFFIGYFFAATSNWRAMFALAAIPSAIMFTGMLFFPESPRWLVRMKKLDKANQALLKIRRSAEDVTKEIEHIKRNLSHEVISWRAVFSPTACKALGIGVAISSLQQLIGINSIIYYAPTIFSLAGFESHVTAILATTGVGTINVLATFIAIYLLDRCGRKKLLISGISGLIITLAVLGGAFLFPPTLNFVPWIALACLMAYVTFFAYSLGPIGFLLNSEIYPLNVRGKMIGIAICCNWISNFLVTSTFLTLINTMGKSLTFWLYGLIGFIGLIFTLKKVPETKGKSLEEIENYWESLVNRN
ncbi:MAG: sugar porter family MFS transporter [Chlamydiota bacterium]